MAVATAPSVSSEPGPLDGTGRRPAYRVLPMASLFRLSVYWLGLVAVFGGIGVIIQERLEGPRRRQGRCGYTTMGSSRRSGSSSRSSSSRPSARSATTRSRRFGRRKPYILIGTLLDVLFLVGIATSNTLFAIAAFVAAPPVQLELRPGPVPGLRARPRASPAGRSRQRPGRAFPGPGRRDRNGHRRHRHADRQLHDPPIMLGVIELATMLSALLPAREGRRRRPRVAGAPVHRR